MNKHFTPNLSPDMVAELDRRRGRGDQSTFNNPDGIVRKRPWLRPDGTHKSTHEGDEMPLPAKRGDETEFERQIRHYSEKVKDDPSKYPGGQRQAIAIAAKEAGVAKNSSTDMAVKALQGLVKDVLSSAHPPPGMQAPAGSRTGIQHAGGVGRIGVTPRATAGGPPAVPPGVASIRNPATAAAHGARLDATAQAIGGAGRGAVARPQSPTMMPKQFQAAGVGKSHEDEERCGDGIAALLDGMKDDDDTKKADDAKQREAARRFGKRERDIHAHQLMTRKSLTGDDRWPEAQKALNSRSMHIMRPLGTYDPYDVVRRGTAIPTHMAHSGENSPLQVRPNASVYKSCTVHGVMHKSDAGCHLCSVQKSTLCKECGASLVKMRDKGGALSCPSGH